MNRTRLANLLRQRAELLRRTRAFFDEAGFLEVETPLLDREIIPETHIQPFAVFDGRADPAGPPHGWLQASPEAGMKRLLAEGAGPIYQITRSFRAGELGPLHRAEFTMLEWYHPGHSMDEGIALLARYCRHVARAEAPSRISFEEAFLNWVGINPHTATTEQLAAAAALHGLDATFAPTDAHNHDAWLIYLLARIVEPRLGASEPQVLYDYPAQQAALATTRRRNDGIEVAERFELYWHGVELANGYHELTDANELRRRLQEVVTQRRQAGHPPLDEPRQLLAAMETGLPPCAGVALGIDRLMMVTTGATSLSEVMYEL